ncbi:MAG TPA: ligase-associated DNA damage response endonuclease PdeM [Caulobacteraceae bacterium]
MSYVWARHPSGGLSLALAGTEVLCRPSGALWLESERVLIVADLHLEKGSAYAARGQMLPPFDTVDTLARLEVEAAALAPRVLVLLGDTFHDGAAEGRLSIGDARRLGALAHGRTLIWVLGNHDAEGPRGLPGESVVSLTAGGLALVHEPRAEATSGEVAGHLHPCAKVAGNGGSVRRRCFVTDGERLIAPAFGAYAGGLNIRDAAFTRLMARTPLAGVLGSACVHAVGWRSLRGD